MIRMFSRTGAGAAALAGIGVLITAGCSTDASSTESSSDEGPVTLNFAWWGGDDRAALQQEVIDAFEAENPGISISAEYSNYDDFWTKLNTQAAANDLPDIFTVIDPFMYDYIDNGRLLDLTTVSDAVDLETIPENLFSMVTKDGAVYGTPSGVASFGVVADPQIFNEAGVDLPDGDTWTWDDVVTTAGAVTAATPEVAGFVLPTDSQVASIWVRQQGEDWGPVDGSAQGLGFTVESMADYWSWVEDLVASGGTQAPDAAIEAASAGGGIEQSPLALHTAAMGVISANQLGALEEAAGREFVFLNWPGESQAPELGAWAKPGTFYAVDATTEHPEEAALFVDFITNSVDAAEVMGFERGVQPNPEVVEALQDSLTPADQRFADYITSLTAMDLQPFHLQDTGAGSVQVSTFDEVNQEVLFGNQTPAEAAQSLYDQMEAALSGS
ncbi:ABC transporter substrate-binding protein [Demequina sp. NBRC 110055]|uniref:ABC transporter substrate-binding protein n=1 Tax=Demequina sp. NBRC 110055 TaxID=1570344 RepID=UPI0013563169|nr:extracellular solute-binding protein [Demequina sp. NBRC 110055]